MDTGIAEKHIGDRGEVGEIYWIFIYSAMQMRYSGYAEHADSANSTLQKSFYCMNLQRKLFDNEKLPNNVLTWQYWHDILHLNLVHTQTICI